MENNRLQSTAKEFEELPYGSVIMGDETYLKCHPDRMSKDNKYVFIPSYSLGVFSAEEVADMLLDAGCGWYVITPKREENNHNG